jgi:hypothetical protein
MKKSIIIAAALAITSVGAFAQGNVNFGGGLHGIWNDYTTPGTAVTSTGIDVAMLFFTTSPTALEAIANGTPTNGSLSYSTAAAWAALENGSTAVNGPSSSTPAVASTLGSGSFSFNGSSSWSASNITGGTTYFAVEVAWSTQGGTLTTLAAAEAAAATDPVGWSQVFTYTPSTGIVSAPGWGTAQTGFFGVAATPEPGTMALAALGGASLLMFRRKK